MLHIQHSHERCQRAICSLCQGGTHIPHSAKAALRAHDRSTDRHSQFGQQKINFIKKTSHMHTTYTPKRVVRTFEYLSLRALYFILCMYGLWLGAFFVFRIAFFYGLCCCRLLVRACSSVTRQRRRY